MVNFAGLLLFVTMKFVTAGASSGECLLCRIFKVDVQFQQEDRVQNEPENIYRCVTDSSQEMDGRTDQSYSIDLPLLGFAANNADVLNTGSAQVCIPGGQIIYDQGSIMIPPGSDISIVEGSVPDRRKLQYTGERSVLVVRVKSNDVGAPSYSANNLAGAVFSLGSEALSLSLRTQYSHCSGNQLHMQPAEGYPGVVDGVLDLDLGTYSMNNVGIFILENELTKQTEDALSIASLSAEFDHIMWCMPTGTTFYGSRYWLAYAYVGGKQSYYNNGWCDKLSAQVHEVAHNLGLWHSSEGTCTSASCLYGDQSNVMGYSYYARNAPAMCFNAAHNYQLGFFQSKFEVADPARNGPFNAYLASFVDFTNPESDVVLVRVGDFFIQYNRRKSYNSGTQEFRDLVVVTKKTTTNSYHQTALGDGESWQFNNVVVEVCSLFETSVSVAELSIYTSTQTSSCGSTADMPISLAPTPFPSRSPTAYPSSAPTTVPTLEPTLSPTLGQSQFPSLFPTSLPTLAPSNLPTIDPTALPTTAPSIFPTMDPTSLPSIELSMPPTMDPTPVPTSDPTPGVPTSDPSIFSTMNPTPLPTLDASEFPTMAPTSLPTLYPVTSAPTVPMPTTPAPITTVAPSSIGDDSCDDSFAFRFFFEGRDRSCGFIRHRPWLVRSLCVEGDLVNEYCVESCGHCSDSCEENPVAEIWINEREGIKTCKWVASSHYRVDAYCHPGHDAFYSCLETCENCNSEYEAPSPAPSPLTCDDSYSFRFFYDNRDRSCGFIRYRQTIAAILCVEGNPVNDACIESCGHCSDSCNEDPFARVYVDDRYGTKTCKWIASSHYRIDLFCNPAYPDVWEHCRETCENCAVVVVS